MNLLLEFYLQFKVDDYWQDRLKLSHGNYLYAWGDASKEREQLINIEIVDGEWTFQSSSNTTIINQEHLDILLNSTRARWERSNEPAP